MLILVGITACAGSGATSYTGRLAKPESMVMLSPGDARELKWQTNDLIIDAVYALGPNTLDLSGLVQLQSRLQHYPIVSRLRIQVHALDGDGVIVGSYPLWSAGHNASHHFINWAFQRNLVVPENTRALTFSYRGQMRDGGSRMGRLGDREGDGVSWDFWHTP